MTNYRFDRRLDSESAALRELVELGLEAAERKADLNKGKPVSGEDLAESRAASLVSAQGRDRGTDAGIFGPRSTKWGPVAAEPKVRFRSKTGRNRGDL